MQTKFMEVLPVLRLMTGSDENFNIDQAWMNRVLKMIGPDGLLYRPYKTNGQFRSFAAGPTSLVMGAMLHAWLRDRNPMWKDTLERMIVRMNGLAIDKGEYKYFPGWGSAGARSEWDDGVSFVPFDKLDPSMAPPTSLGMNDGFNTRILQQIGRYYALTGFKPAREFGDKLMKFDRYHADYFDSQTGAWLVEKLDPKVYPGRYNDIGFGSHSHTLYYMTEYVIDTGSREDQQWVKRSFEWAMRRNGELPGYSATATKIGFFPEYLNAHYKGNENCCTADMISIGIRLSRAGIGDYWDQVDGWVRNQFAENQITNLTWKSNLRTADGKRYAPNREFDRQMENTLGCSVIHSTANDGASAVTVAFCCTGVGSRALYHVWEAIMDCQDDRLRVNLLLNRASKWADLDSYIPYQGRVELKVKQPLKEISLCAPQWSRPAAAS